MEPLIQFLTLLQSGGVFYTLLGILIGSFANSFLSDRYNHKLKETEYRNAYYTKLIDKRIATYECVESLLKMSSMLMTTGDGRIYYGAIGSSDENFKALLMLYHNPDINRRWLSKATEVIMMDFNQMLLKVGSWRDEIGDNLEAIVDKAIELSPEFGEIKNRLREQVRQDWLTLYDIPTFLKAGPVSKYLIIPKDKTDNVYPT